MNRDINQMMLSYWPMPEQFMDNAEEYYKACMIHLLAHAEADGVIITVERTPLQPLAMRNHVARVDVRAKR